MAKERNPFILIPIVLNVVVLMIIPRFAQEVGIAQALLVSFTAMAFPWLLFYIIGRGIDHVISKEIEKREVNDNHDFV